MSLTPGTSLGVYEIVSLLGAGGMGEVYRARDMKLGRMVAIKVLPDALAADADRIARFEREAKVLAALNHPHIATLFGLDQSDGRHLLVMELVDGDTVADRLQRGPLPLEETLRIALQIADALEAAHEKGIVHRDLKPANVKLTADGAVKVLDFGLAKAMSAEAPSRTGTAGLTHSPTLSMMATEAGLILGTAAYMSPEQAKGFPADQRSDVFSFGVVLYEMLTGRQPFQGETAPDVLASVLVREPDLSTLSRDLNPRLGELVQRCLEKNPKRRWQAIGDVRAELEIIAGDPRGASSAMRVPRPRPLWRRILPIAATAIIAGLLAGAIVWEFRPRAAAPTVARFSIALPEGQAFTNSGRHMIAISPDGTHFAYTANFRLYVRSLSQLDAWPIAGSETSTAGGITNPVFSPDSESIAFYSVPERALKRVAVTGGSATTICPANNPFGMSWDGDSIIFGQGGTGIMRVSANGGAPEQFVKVQEGEVAHGPQILPDGQTVLFTVTTGRGDVERWDKAQIVLYSLTSGQRKTVIEGGSDARYLPTGHIVYAIGGVMFAVRFDLRRLTVVGGPVSILEGVRRSAGAQTGAAHFSVSQAGSVVYVPGPASATSAQRLVAVSDRTSGVVTLLKIPPGPYAGPRLSPDRTSIAFGSDDGKEANIWIYNLAGTSAMRRLTFGGRNVYPVWSADSRRIAFASDRGGDTAVYWQTADGTGVAERLTKPEPGVAHTPETWSPREDRLLFAAKTATTVTLWTLSLDDRKAARFDSIESSQVPGAIFSPDGRWVAYGSREAGRNSNILYVQPVPPTGAKYQISKEEDDGHHPLWSADGRELFFTPGPARFGVVRVSTTPTFTFGDVQLIRRQFNLSSGFDERPYDMAADGKGLLGLVNVDDTPALRATTSPPLAASPPIQIVLNWFEELKQRVPVK